MDKVEELTKPEKRDHKGPYTTELGVILKYNKVSSDAIRKAWTAIPVPQPPLVWIEDRGRNEPNPADPGYNNELQQYNNRVQLVIHTIYLMRGVDVFKIPDGISKPEDTDWYEGFEEYWDIPQGKLARKASWLMYYVLNDTERDNIIQDLMILSGLVPEEAVEEAINSFRSDGIPETDTEVQSKE